MCISFFRKKSSPKKIPERTVDYLKRKVRILFIDDENFSIVKQLKDKDGWILIKRIVDVDSISQQEVKESHIIFVDIQGVGNKLGLPDGGLGLIVAIKEQYPEKKVVMYSAENNGKIDAFHPAASIVDGRLRKTANRYQFATMIKRMSEDLFCLDNCAKNLRRVLKEDFFVDMSEDEIKKNIEQLYNEGDTSHAQICKAFNLSNAGSIASIVQLLLLI